MSSHALLPARVHPLKHHQHTCGGKLGINSLLVVVVSRLVTGCGCVVKLIVRGRKRREGVLQVFSKKCFDPGRCCESTPARFKLLMLFQSEKSRVF